MERGKGEKNKRLVSNPWIPPHHQVPRPLGEKRLVFDIGREMDIKLRVSREKFPSRQVTEVNQSPITNIVTECPLTRLQEHPLSCIRVLTVASKAPCGGLGAAHWAVLECRG